MGQKQGPTRTFPATVTEAALSLAPLGRARLLQVPWACCPLTRDPFPSVLSSHKATRSRWVSDDRLVIPGGGLGSTQVGLFPTARPLAWEDAHPVTSAAPESSGNQKCTALGLACSYF